MHFVLAGPGALGCLFSFYIDKGLGSDHTLQLVDHNPVRAVYLQEEGISYRAGKSKHHCKVDVTAESQGSRIADVLFLCVKSYDLDSCIERCLPLIGDETVVVFLQNGIGHLDFGKKLIRGIPVFGTTSEGANLVGTGKVVHAGRGTTFLGFPDQQSSKKSLSKLLKVVAILEEAGLQTKYVENIVTRLWAKLFVNTGINALTALHGCSNGHLLNDERLKQEMKKAVQEAVLVAEKSGIPLLIDPLKECVTVCQNTANNISSMLQDVRAERKTEIDSINGAIVLTAMKVGVATPVNASLLERIKKVEASYKIAAFKI